MCQSNLLAVQNRYNAVVQKQWLLVLLDNYLRSCVPAFNIVDIGVVVRLSALVSIDLMEYLFKSNKSFKSGVDKYSGLCLAMRIK